MHNSLRIDLTVTSDKNYPFKKLWTYALIKEMFKFCQIFFVVWMSLRSTSGSIYCVFKN